MDIPIIEHADLLDDRGPGLARAAEGLARGFGELGLVYVRGHGIDRARVESLYDAFLEVLARPESEKRTWGGPSLWYQRGWTPPNTEQAVIAGGQPDYKECYFAAPVPTDPLCRNAWPQVYADNVWPEDAEAFRELMLEVGGELHHVGLRLLRACEQALGVEPGDIVRRTEGGAHVSRALKYLPIGEGAAASMTAGGERRIVWGEEHTDFNVLTLLPGGSFFRADGARDTPERAGGLYLRTRPTESHPSGQMVRGKPPAGCLVAQVGQQLEVLSAGRFQATPHVIMAPEEPGWSRTSLAHFVHLNGRQTVEPLPPLMAEAGDAFSPPVLAGTYAMKTLVDIGLAPPEVLHGLGYRHYGRLAAIRADR